MPSTSATDRLYSKITWALIPFMFLLYVVAYLDRINYGFASLTMQKDLHLTETLYGFGAGVFFIGYFLLEVPSNLLMVKVGARRWVARIMITWGIVACATMFARGIVSLATLRFILGAAEAGFFPGMVLYLTYWFPADRRAKAMSAFFTATAIAGAIGSWVSAQCLAMEGVGGLHGWQWLFLLEGIPSVVLGVLVLFFLPNGPREVSWLTDEEKDTIADALREEDRPHHELHDLGAALRDWRLWLLSAIYFLVTVGLYGFGFFAPKLLKAHAGTLTNERVTLLVAIPYCIAAIAMVLIGRNSDRTGERHWHIALSSAASAVGFALTAYAHGAAPTLAALSLAAIGIWGAFGCFWTLPTAFLRGTAAAGGIAVINSVGCLSGLAAPWVVGKLFDLTHAYTAGVLAIAGSMLAGGLLVFGAKVRPQLSPAPSVLTMESGASADRSG